MNAFFQLGREKEGSTHLLIRRMSSKEGRREEGKRGRDRIGEIGNKQDAFDSFEE